MNKLTADDLLALKSRIEAITPAQPGSFAEVLATELRALMPGCILNAAILDGFLSIVVTYQEKTIHHEFSSYELFALSLPFSGHTRKCALSLVEQFRYRLIPDVINIDKDFQGLIELTGQELRDGVRKAKTTEYILRVIKPQAEIIQTHRYMDVNYHFVVFRWSGGLWQLVTQINYV